MTTYAQVMEIFQNYLADTPCVEVVLTKWGYVRIFYEEPYLESMEAVLCQTPEELFEMLLEHSALELEYQLSRKTQKSERTISEIVKMRKDFYIKKLHQNET